MAVVPVLASFAGLLKYPHDSLFAYFEHAADGIDRHAFAECGEDERLLAGIKPCVCHGVRYFFVVKEVPSLRPCECIRQE